jgi:NitT/TauT family transport system ATP-binding protein
VTGQPDVQTVPPLLEVSGVSYSYKPSLPPVMEGIDLSIRSGEFFVLLGPSGCGKTTILNQVAGFEKPTTGTIALKGERITGPGPDRAVVFQGHESLLGWLTVRQNVEFPLKVAGVGTAERRARAQKVLELVELAHQADKFPHELSGGMKQRVQIARGLVTDSRVVLMDEPFGALDAQTRGTLQAELSDIWERERRTVLFITHDIAEAVILADRVGVMSAGPRAYLHSIVPIDLPRPRRRTAEFNRYIDLLEATVSAAKARRPLDQGAVAA